MVDGRRQFGNFSSKPDCGDAMGNVARTATFGAAASAPNAHAERARLIWSAGDYERIAEGFRHEAEAFVERVGIKGGDRVLDAACGSGNLAIPAARRGARVIGCDIVPELLESAAERAAREALVVGLDYATVEALPYGNARFDVVVSMFGVMFAARPACVMAELARVTAPGGRVAMANWTSDGFAGRMLAMHASYAAPTPGIPSPLLWGDEAVIRERFDERMWTVTTTRRTLTFRYPHSPAGTAELFRKEFGPTVRTFEQLDEDRRALLASALTEQWITHHRNGAHRTEVESEFLEVIAIRR